MSLESYVLNEIRKIVFDCEDVQISNESTYTKEEEKKSAYEKIKELVMENPIE